VVIAEGSRHIGLIPFDSDEFDGASVISDSTAWTDAQR